MLRGERDAVMLSALIAALAFSGSGEAQKAGGVPHRPVIR